MQCVLPKKVDQKGMECLLYRANLDGLPVFQELFEHVRLKWKPFFHKKAPPLLLLLLRGPGPGLPIAQRATGGIDSLKLKADSKLMVNQIEIQNIIFNNILLEKYNIQTHIRMGIKALSGLYHHKRLVILNSCHNMLPLRYRILFCSWRYNE